MKSIAHKMAQIGHAVGWGVPKDGRNQSQGYDYTSAAGVRMTVGPQLASRGIAVSSSVEVLFRDAFTNAKGSRMHHVMIRTTLTFVDSESGESMTSQALGEGVDSGDKASAKALTMSEKYAYVSAFTLAMGEDPEKDEPQPKGKPQRKDDGTMGAPLHTYAMDEGQKARAAKQAESRPSDDEARIQADSWVSQFTAMTHVDEVTAFLPTMIAQWDKSPAKHRSRVYKACQSHVEKGIVEGLSDVGFREAWGLYVGLARDGKVS